MRPSGAFELRVHVDAAHHGSGAGAALLDAVLDPAEPTVLWVTDPNPRARAFHRKQGFGPDGVHRLEHGVRHVRYVRFPGGGSQVAMSTNRE